MKSPRRVIMKAVKKEHIDNEGSSFSSRSLFALPPDGGSIELDSFNFGDEISDHDLLLDVPSNRSFIQLQALAPNCKALVVAQHTHIFYEILKIQKFRRIVSYTGFYSFTALIVYAYTNNTTRAGYSRADQFYAAYPAGTELLTDSTKLYKTALGNCFEVEEWGPIEYCIMAKHFERQGKSPYAYHAQYMAHLLSHGQLDGSG